MSGFTYAGGMRRCGKCSSILPINSKGWSKHRFFGLICPVCTQKSNDPEKPAECPASPT